MPVVPARFACPLVVTLIATGALLLVAGPADAHITVAADDSAQGAADSILTFRVPNEEDKAVTTKVQFTFPIKNPIASVKASPKPGWKVTTTPVTFAEPIKTDDGTITGGVGQVTYTAEGAANAIPVGQFQTFQILVGPLPAAASVAFPTVQTYSDGTIVRWIEPVTGSVNEPEHPTPILPLTTAAMAPAAVGQASVTTTPDSDQGRLFGIIGAVLGALGLLGSGLALQRTRRDPR